jgi:N-acetylmuramoyl-L-alanine amidase
MHVRLVLAAAALATGIGCGVGAQAQQPMPPQLTYVQPLSPRAVQAVQQHLRQAGDYAGNIDGVWGPDSVTALQRFQQTHGLQVTGQLNQATVATLGLDPDALFGNGTQTANAAQAPVAGESLSPQAVRTVQQRLAQLGFYRGPDDGVWGPETQNAITRFQESRGLQANSQLNPATISALGLQPGVFAAR